MPRVASGEPFSAALCRGLIEAVSDQQLAVGGHLGFPRLYAAASLKRSAARRAGRRRGGFSAALCRGLIEASQWSAAVCRFLKRFPRLYAAASLKLHARAQRLRDLAQFSAALCRGLIEAASRWGWPDPGATFSAALCRGLIEAIDMLNNLALLTRFPRLYAAASLKHRDRRHTGHTHRRFSAALCRGLIEARIR